MPQTDNRRRSRDTNMLELTQFRQPSESVLATRLGVSGAQAQDQLRYPRDCILWPTWASRARSHLLSFPQSFRKGSVVYLNSHRRGPRILRMVPYEQSCLPCGRVRSLSGCVTPLSGCVTPLSGCVKPLSGCVKPLSGSVKPVSGCI